MGLKLLSGDVVLESTFAEAVDAYKMTNQSRDDSSSGSHPEDGHPLPEYGNVQVISQCVLMTSAGKSRRLGQMSQYPDNCKISGNELPSLYKNGIYPKPMQIRSRDGQTLWQRSETDF